MKAEMKVTSTRYFETRRGLGYECKTNIIGLSIWNDGQGGNTFLDGNENTKDYRIIGRYSEKYSDDKLEKLIDKYEINIK